MRVHLDPHNLSSFFFCKNKKIFLDQKKILGTSKTDACVYLNQFELFWRLRSFLQLEDECTQLKQS